MHLSKAFLLAVLGGLSINLLGDDYRDTTRLSPDGYFLRSVDQYQDPVFDTYRTVDLGATVGIGSDCGRVDFTNTLRSSFRNLLDSKYFSNIGQNIIASSPMLLACYFSPTWCAILKHSQVGAHYLSQMRLDQCSIIDKYTDNRVQDFYEARQTCVRKAIDENGGDLEHAMESCEGNKLWDLDLANWSGKENGETVSENRLIEASAKWAGLDGPEARSSLNLVKALVGDTVVSKGSVGVEYGGRQSALTPRTYFQSIEKSTYDRLCHDMMQKMEEAGYEVGSDRLISDQELKVLSPTFKSPLIDRQTLRAISLMPSPEREMACKNLSDAISTTVFSSDLNRSLDILTTLSQNPNLPPNRKQEIEDKRKALKDSVEMAVTLQRQKNTPLKTVLSEINQEGQRLQSERMGDALSRDAAEQSFERIQTDFMNCADNIMCGGR